MTVTEAPEAVTVALRIHERKTPLAGCPMSLIHFQVPFELKEPLGNRKLLGPTADLPKALTAQPDHRRYYSIPVQVIRKS